MTHTETLAQAEAERMLARVSDGQRLEEADLGTLARASNILALGMMADVVRRRLHGATVTYLRVWNAPDTPVEPLAVPAAARELRAGRAPSSLPEALELSGRLKASAEGRTVTGFGWADVERWSSAGDMASVLRALRAAGLDGLAEVAIDDGGRVFERVRLLAETEFPQVRLTVSRAALPSERLRQFLDVAAVAEAHPGVITVSPLPMSLNPLRPTTGYDDVKAVALARLALPSVPHVQVDWLRYGPKLAQVALTFGADDIDNVSPDDEAPEGRRRAPVEELRRNVESAGLQAVARDGRFVQTPA